MKRTQEQLKHELLRMARATLENARANHMEPQAYLRLYVTPGHREMVEDLVLAMAGEQDENAHRVPGHVNGPDTGVSVEPDRDARKPARLEARLPIRREIIDHEIREAGVAPKKRVARDSREMNRQGALPGGMTSSIPATKR